MDILDLTIKELHQKLADKELSARELVDFYLGRIDKYDGDLQSYLLVTKEEAEEMSIQADEILKQVQNDKSLIGIPASIKDVIVTKDVVSTGGSKILANYIPPYDATVIRKLKDQNYILLGKTNCDEFAMGSSTENSGFGPSKNPWDTNRVPGGSSGGSAAAVAAGLCHYSLGTDTGGSIRQPASLCGVVGFKPTYGRVSRYGLMAMASSLDQCGVFARRVEDVREVLKAIEGRDDLDATSASHPEFSSGSGTMKPASPKRQRGEQVQGDNLRGVKVGVPTEYFGQGLDKQVEKIIKEAIKKMAELGAEIKEVSLPNFEYALATYYIIMPAEVSSNMARYDGIRYGESVVGTNLPVASLEDLYKANRSKYLGDEVKRRIMLGTYVLSAGYYDQYYGLAQKVRQLIKQDFVKVFQEVDVLAGPVAPTPAFKIGEKTSDPLAMYLEDIYTVPVNLAGLPALSVPAGFSEVAGKKLPVGLHLIGKWWEDYKLLHIAQVYEQSTEHYKVKTF